MRYASVEMTRESWLKERDSTERQTRLSVAVFLKIIRYNASNCSGAILYIIDNLPFSAIFKMNDALKELIRQKSLKFGDFTLASGKKAKYYLDGKQVTLDGEAARLIGQGIVDLIREEPAFLSADGTFPDAVGGMSIGADPITASVITLAAINGIPLRGFMVRKQSKGHGTNQYIEGPVREGDRVVILEDVVTTGGSSLEAIERVEAAGITVLGVVAIIDRVEGGAEAFRGKGYVFRSLFTIRDFGIEPPQLG